MLVVAVTELGMDLLVKAAKVEAETAELQLEAAVKLEQQIEAVEPEEDNLVDQELLLLDTLDHNKVQVEL